MTKMLGTPVQGNENGNKNPNLNSGPVAKAKKLWHQKTMRSKENLFTASNLFSMVDGTYLNLNNTGIIDFPVDLLQRLSTLQVKSLSF